MSETNVQLGESLSQSQAGRRSAIIIFIALQCLDLLTTLAVFTRGGMELNPVVRSLMPLMGRPFAIVVCKAFLIALVLLFSRRLWVLRFANVLYSGVVLWNVFVLWKMR